MKRIVFLSLALLIGILLPIQSIQSRTTPWENDPWNVTSSDDHPWGGDGTDPGGIHITPGGDNGYIRMSIIGRLVNYAMPIILRLYTKGQTTQIPISRTILKVAPPNSAPIRTIQMSGGK